MAEQHLNQVYLSLGSNIEPKIHLQKAVEKLSEAGQIEAVSSVWKTEPFGYSEQDPFLNAAVLLRTNLSATQICDDLIPKIESQLNRVRDPSNKNGPRTIDIDLTLFNSEVLKIGHRDIPDPELLTRGFVAIPIAELNPEYIHPVVNQSLGEIASRFDPEQLGMELLEDFQPGPSDSSSG